MAAWLEGRYASGSHTHQDRLFTHCCATLCYAVLLRNVNTCTEASLSLFDSSSSQVAFVSMFSVSNATGRLFFGCASEQLLHTRGTRRPTFLVALSLMLAIFSGCMAIANIPAMYPLAVFGGVAFGGQWAVIPSVVADLFGITHFASTYAVIQIAPAAGNFLLGTMLVGTVYEAAKKHSATPDNRYCLGSACYATTWLIILGLNLVSLLGSVVLMLRSTVMYQRIHERVKQQSS